MKWNGSGGMAAGKKAERQWGCKHGIGTNEDSFVVVVIPLKEFQGISVRFDLCGLKNTIHFYPLLSFIDYITTLFCLYMRIINL